MCRATWQFRCCGWWWGRWYFRWRCRLRWLCFRRRCCQCCCRSRWFRVNDLYRTSYEKKNDERQHAKRREQKFEQSRINEMKAKRKRKTRKGKKRKEKFKLNRKRKIVIGNWIFFSFLHAAWVCAWLANDRVYILVRSLLGPVWCPVILSSYSVFSWILYSYSARPADRPPARSVPWHDHISYQNTKCK